MRTAIFALAAFSLISGDAYGIFVAVGDDDLDRPSVQTIGNASNSTLRLDLMLANSSNTLVDLSSAQIALSIEALPGSNGILGISLVDGVPSLFGSPAISPFPANPTTITAGSFPAPATLAADSRELFATIDIEVQPDAAGVFELVLLGISPDISESSQWLPPGTPPLIPLPVAFQNTTTATGGGILLATVTVVPEPGGALLGTAAVLGIGWLAGRSRQ